MSPAVGDVVLVRMPALQGVEWKLRPALVLSLLPGPFQSVLLCGISTARLDEVITGWDLVFEPNDADFAQTGLQRACVARLSFIFAAGDDRIEGMVGSVATEKLRAARAQLAQRILD